MRGEPWSDIELQSLYDVVNYTDYLDLCRPYLPDRSEAAIRTKMCLLRLEAGIVPLLPGPRSKSRRKVDEQLAQQGSDALRRKIMEMAL